MDVVAIVLFSSISSNLIEHAKAERSRLGDTEIYFTADIVSIFVTDADLPYTLELVQPAVEVAIEKIRKLYPHIEWKSEFHRSSTHCTTSNAGAIAAEVYYERRVTAFMGPACSLALDSVGRMASTWNVPIYSAGTLDITFADKNIFSTLTELCLSLGRLSDFILKILKYFEWHHVAIIVDDTNPREVYIKRSLLETFENDHEYDVFVSMHEFMRNRRRVNLTNILRNGMREARVFIILAPGETVRQILLAAYDLGMGNGEFVFLTVEFFRNKRSFGDFSWYQPGDSRNEDAKAMYEALMVVSVRVPDSDEYSTFSKDVIDRSKTRFNTTLNESSVNVIIAGFHDCVLIYAWALNKTLSEGDDPLDGRTLVRRMWNNTYRQGLTGDIYINDNGAREADYTLNDLIPGTKDMQALLKGISEAVILPCLFGWADSRPYSLPKPVATYFGTRQIYEPAEDVTIHWPGGKDPVRDIPKCGFLGDDPTCIVNETMTFFTAASVAIGFFLLTSLVFGVIIIHRRMKFESELSSLWWKVRWSSIVFHEPYRKSVTAFTADELVSISTHKKTDPSNSTIIENIPQGTTVGFYKGTRVAVKPLNIKRLPITRTILLELKQMRDASHENLIRFVGLCVEESNIAILTEFSPRGSLRDLLENEAIQIDWPFRSSLIRDVVEGMTFLHESPIGFHGRLKSTNCVIDSRFVVKLTDFGLRTIISQVVPEETINPRMLLWTAPEHLRGKHPEREASQKGDVYSFAIVLQEIITRTGPFENLSQHCSDRHHMEPQDIIRLLKVGTTPPIRPEVSPNDCCTDLIDMLHQCWDERPEIRPTFSSIRHQIKKINRGQGNSNFLDNLLSRMEQYANNLEALVEEKTAAFLEEKKKSEELLYEVLPRYVAEQLKAGNHVRPESFECVTIYFSDIVGFTALSANSTPMQIVDLLNDLYTCFDAIIGNYNVYKVETIGDAYMVVSGLPIRNGNAHAREIAQMSLSLRSAIQVFKIRHRPNTKLQLRIGIHSGPCAAGVVGLKMPRYCLFGDTVNTASRMETSGEAMKIHVSSETKAILDTFYTFRLVPRGEVEIKGKGLMRTYWLEAEETLPNMSEDLLNVLK